MFERSEIRQGMLVRSRDGERIGRVVEIADSGILVEQGYFFARDYRLPWREVGGIQGKELFLVRDREQLRRMDQREEAGVVAETAAPATAPATTTMPATTPLRGGLGLHPRDLEEARMDSAKFQDHGQYRAISADEDRETVVVGVPDRGGSETAAPRIAGPDADPLKRS
jgi:hypothetical protein